MKIKTANIILYCKRWNETVDFYRNRLKLEVTASLDWFVEFKLNDCSRLSIADEERSSIKSSSGKGITVTMRVEDIYETFSFLEKAGVNPTPVKNHAWGAKIIHVYDPEGNRIEFWFE